MPRIRRYGAREYHRSKSVWCAVYIVLAILAGWTLHIQLEPDPRIMKQSQKQYWANVAVSAARGDIDDRNGVPLAISVPVKSFFIDPKFWNPASSDMLVKPFGKEAAKKFAKPLDGRFHWVQRGVPADRAGRIDEMKIPGLYSLSAKKRVYPQGSLAFHVLGFCDIDGCGQAGVEREWDSILFSPPRTRFLAKDSRGRTQDVMGGRTGALKHTSGSLRLTIDIRIQQILEWRIKEAADKAGAVWASGVCVDPWSGEILALASYPTIDPNNRRELVNEEAVRNNVVGRVFEPGSVFKPITMSVAIETGAANRNSIYNCRGTMVLADKTMSDVNKKPHGRQNLTQVLMNSCNIGMSVMSMGVPKHQAYGMLRQFGFGEKSGVEIAGEEAGLVKSPEEWLGTVQANIFIGQGISVTPLQLAMAISAVANGGALLKPYIVAEVRDSEGRVVHKGERRPRHQVMSKQTSDFLRNAMMMVVKEGGGRKAYSDKVGIGGKTGTAQVAGRKGGYVKGRYTASFVGFWPVNKPKYVMVINIGEPKGKAYYGGQIAAPVFKAVVEDMMQIAMPENLI